MDLPIGLFSTLTSIRRSRHADIFAASCLRGSIDPLTPSFGNRGDGEIARESAANDEAFTLCFVDASEFWNLCRF
jgi:hypothetical protein